MFQSKTILISSNGIAANICSAVSFNSEREQGAEKGNELIAMNEEIGFGQNLMRKLC